MAFIINENLCTKLGLTIDSLESSLIETNSFLRNLPALFSLDSVEFFTILNQRNLSGLVGEIFKKAIANNSKGYIPNPHPDGRPDLIDLRSEESREYFFRQCLSKDENLPIRSRLAPYQFGGLEIKSTLGITKGKASKFLIGESRSHDIRDITYWAHHQHECDLLGIYYDFCADVLGSPQVRGLFFGEIKSTDWQKVSTGKAGSKKTSNTSLTLSGKAKMKSNLVAYWDQDPYPEALVNIGAQISGVSSN